MSSGSNKTLRLEMPQWQGGNNKAYYLGAQLLAWLAPKGSALVEQVNVSFDKNTALSNENNIYGRSEIIPQIEDCQNIINKHNPDNIVMLGGDCLVDLAPFSYLIDKYGDDLGVLWIDAHPDIMTSNEFQHAHATVLGALMGFGDKDLTQFVKKTISPKKIMYAGVNSENEYEKKFIEKHQLRICRPEEIQSKIMSIQQWIADEKIKYLAIHLDLDVLSTSHFGSLLFSNRDYPEDMFTGVAQGKLSISDVISVIQSATSDTNVVGMGIAEHLPWDAINLKSLLETLPLLNE
jgi:arginase